MFIICHVMCIYTYTHIYCVLVCSRYCWRVLLSLVLVLLLPSFSPRPVQKNRTGSWLVAWSCGDRLCHWISLNELVDASWAQHLASQTRWPEPATPSPCDPRPTSQSFGAWRYHGGKKTSVIRDHHPRMEGYSLKSGFSRTPPSACPVVWIAQS